MVEVVKLFNRVQKILFLCGLCLICTSESIISQEIVISQDSVFLDVKKHVIPGNRFRLSHAVKINHEIYCVFEEYSLFSYRKEKKHFVSINAISKEVNWLSFPKKMNDAIYFDLYEKNSQIHLLDYHDKSCFVYKIDSDRWSRNSKCNDVVYEDDKYKIAYQDHGEWGEYTWFLNLETGIEYVIEENGEQINKIDEKYYLSSTGKIVEVESPNLLKRCNDQCYFNSKRSTVTNPEGPSFQYLYNDSITSLDVTFGAKRNLHIESSWVWNDQLIQLYSTDSTTEVGLVRNSSVIPITRLANVITILSPNDSYRGNSNHNNYRFHHYWRDENNFGFIELKDGEVSLLNLGHNQDSLQYFNENLFYSYWEKLNSFENVITVKNIRAYENKSGGIKLDEDRSGQSPGVHPVHLVTPKSQFETYIKIENKDIAQTIQYHFDKVGGNLQSVHMEWAETETYKTKLGFDHLFQSTEAKEIIFSKKYNFLIHFIAEKTGVKPKIDLSSSYSKYAVWELDDNHRIEISAPKDMSINREIRLVIY